MDDILAIIDIMINFTLSTSAFLCGGRVPWFLYCIGLGLALTIISIFVPWITDTDSNIDDD